MPLWIARTIEATRSASGRSPRITMTSPGRTRSTRNATPVSKLATYSRRLKGGSSPSGTEPAGARSAGYVVPKTRPSAFGRIILVNRGPLPSLRLTPVRRRLVRRPCRDRPLLQVGGAGPVGEATPGRSRAGAGCHQDRCRRRTCGRAPISRRRRPRKSADSGPAALGSLSMNHAVSLWMIPRRRAG